MKHSLFFLFIIFISTLASARVLDKTSAQVNSAVILSSDLKHFRKTFSVRKEIDPLLSYTQLDVNNDRSVTDYLIQENLIIQKYPATSEEVEEEINAVQKNNKIDRNHLKTVLTAQGIEFSNYQELMKIGVSKRKLIDRELRLLAAVSDDDVKNFYYTDPDFSKRRKEQKLVLSYTLQQVLVPSQTLVDLIRKRVNGGENLDSLVSELAGRGVESTKLENLSEENMNATILRAIQNLRVGEITSPVAMGNGFMILKILEIGAPKDPVYEKEKERIRGMLFQKGLSKQIQIWTDRERASAFVHAS